MFSTCGDFTSRTGAAHFSGHCATLPQEVLAGVGLLEEQAAEAKSAKGDRAAKRNANFVICFRVEVLAIGRTPWLKRWARSSDSPGEIG